MEERGKERYERFKQERLDQGVLDKLEQRRAEYLAIGERAYEQPVVIGCMVLLLGIFFALDKLTGSVIPIYVYMMIFAVLAPMLPKVALSPKKANYRQAFQEALIEEMIPYLEEDLQYDPLGGIDRYRIASAMTFPFRKLQVHSENKITGWVGGTEMELAEVFVTPGGLEPKEKNFAKEKGREKGKIRVMESIKRDLTGDRAPYIGLYMIMDFNKSFSSQAVLRPRKFKLREFPAPKGTRKARKRKMRGREEPRWSYAPSKHLKDPEHGIELEKVELEDPDFEERYNLYSNDPVESRYIFSPTLMERVIDLQKRWDKKLFMAFKDSKLHLSLPYYNGVFQPEPASSSRIEEHLEQLFLNLEHVFEIVEELRLNDRIWSKK